MRRSGNVGHGSVGAYPPNLDATVIKGSGRLGMEIPVTSKAWKRDHRPSLRTSRSSDHCGQNSLGVPLPSLVGWMGSLGLSSSSGIGVPLTRVPLDLDRDSLRSPFGGDVDATLP